jgi:hypothetical protein
MEGHRYKVESSLSVASVAREYCRREEERPEGVYILLSRYVASSSPRLKFVSALLK